MIHNGTSAKKVSLHSLPILHPFPRFLHTAQKRNALVRIEDEVCETEVIVSDKALSVPVGPGEIFERALKAPVWIIGAFDNGPIAYGLAGTEAPGCVHIQRPPR